MNWKSWKLGLFVAFLTGLCSCLATGAIVPSATPRELLFIFALSIAKDVLLWLKSHPPEAVTFNVPITENNPPKNP